MDILVSSPFLAKYSQPRRVATRLLQELAALRRQLPMVRIHDPARFQFDTPDGGKSLLDLFEGRKQLTLYHFMLGPHETQGCVGCSFCVNHIPDLRHPWSRDTSFVAWLPRPCLESLPIGIRWAGSFRSIVLQKRTNVGRS